MEVRVLLVDGDHVAVGVLGALSVHIGKIGDPHTGGLL